MLQCSNFKQRLSSFQATENDLPEELFKKKPKKHKYSSAWAGEEGEPKHHCKSGCDVYYPSWSSQGLLSNAMGQFLWGSP